MAAAVEANVSAFLSSMGGAGGGLERRDDEIVWTVGGSPIGYHNAVVACIAGGVRASALIEEWSVELRRRGVPGSWHVSPSMRPADLPARLTAAGFDDGGDEPAMAADLTGGLPVVPRPAGFVVEPIVDPGGLDAYRRVLGSGFGEGPKEADWVADTFARIGLVGRSDAAWHHYVGRLDGEAVSTASLFLTPADVAGIYFVSTAPPWRRRGLGTSITHHLMLEAAALGCTLGVLGSSPMGHAIYQRLGFTDVFTYRLFELTP